MKVLFLDVDGVLNSWGSGFAGSGTRQYDVLGREQCDRLRKVLVQTDARVVVSSTWRKNEACLDALWVLLGPEIKERWAGYTPVLDRQQQSGVWIAAPRGNEIQAWLNTHPEVRVFAIVDDEADMGELSDYLVQTNGMEGLSDRDAERLIAMLLNNAEVCTP